MKNFNAIFFLKIFISMFYIAFGMYLVTNPLALGYSISQSATMIIGAVLILYGIFRGYRVYKSQADNVQ